MRSFSTLLALAAVGLPGAVLAGSILRSLERPAEVRRDVLASGFYAPPPGAVLPAAPSPGQEIAGQGLPNPRRAPYPEFHEFFFTRAIYSDGRGGGFYGRYGRREAWATDWPKADRQFLVVLNRLLGIDAYDDENSVSLDDPRLRQYPFIYALEVGNMQLTQEEVRGLRSYLDAGGFLVIDDFWGSWEWANFEHEISRVLPGRPIVDLPMDHELFRAFYNIEEILQVPNVRQGRSGGPTWERDGRVPMVKGIFDDHGRLMVVINWNTDLGDAWEWAEDPWYPLTYSTFAYEMGANMIVYGMSH